jgi:hypothetical protein
MSNIFEYIEIKYSITLIFQIQILSCDELSLILCKNSLSIYTLTQKCTRSYSDSKFWVQLAYSNLCMSKLFQFCWVKFQIYSVLLGNDLLYQKNEQICSWSWVILLNILSHHWWVHRFPQFFYSIYGWVYVHC